MDVVYDTGSDWLVVEGNNCSSCEGNVYDPASSQGTPIQVNANISVREYGSASLSGYEYLDKVCINLSACLDSFEYFLISKQQGIGEPIDGILGLSRNNPFILAPEKGNITGPLFIEKLADAEVINANKFSFYFQQPDETSFVNFGEPTLEHNKAGSIPVTTQMLEDDFWWSTMNSGIAIGVVSNAYAYEQTNEYPVQQENNSLYSIIDTGSSALMISSIYYEDLIIQLFDYAGITDWAYD